MNENELRDHIAIEVLNTLLNNEGRRRWMKLHHRIIWWLGIDLYTHSKYFYNYESIIKSSYIVADKMLKHRRLNPMKSTHEKKIK